MADIRSALEQVPGALIWEPEDEPSGGRSAGSPIAEHRPRRQEELEDYNYDIRVSAPTGRASSAEVDDADAESIDDPPFLFEVPPALTADDVFDVLGRDRIAEMRQRVQIWGVDALAWYVSFHQRRLQAGVYVPAQGPLYLALLLSQQVKGIPFERLVDLSYQAILRHELFHFEVDCMTANWELATGKAVHWKAKARYRAASGYVEREEALANAYMLRGFKHPTASRRKAPGVHNALKDFCAAQGAGYRDGPHYGRSRTAYLAGCSELSVRYATAADPARGFAPAFDALLLYNDPVRIDWTRCPIMLSDDAGVFERLGIEASYFQSIPSVIQTATFERQFRKLSESVQRCWEKQKSILKTTTATRGVAFKRWKPKEGDWYSVRVNDKYRAHLRYDRAGQRWYAEEIGDHKRMGHG